MKIVTVEQMRELERRSQEEGVSVDALMENAGLAVARRAWELIDKERGAPCLVLVGPGNNGGDGLVAARHLHDWGAEVAVYICLPRPALDPKLALLQERAIQITRVQEDPSFHALKKHLVSCRLVIDAILGTGRARAIEATLKDVLQELRKVRKSRRAGLTLMALDLPTGLDADSGAVDPSCTPADVTVTLGYPKKGLFCFPGADYAGRMEIADIGIPQKLARDIPLELITPQWVARVLPARSRGAHKGTFGRVLVVAGSRNYVGAAYLACSGALRSGAGLVTLATPASIYPILASKLTEATYLPLPESESGQADPSASALVTDALPDCEALLVGCGTGQSQSTGEFLRQMLLSGHQTTTPLVLDADALNILAQEAEWWKKLTALAILTPHPGEMARLTGQSIAQVQAHRIEIAQQAAQEWRQVIVLKGAFTVVASPDGMTRLSPFANPALASGGTGDVLAGVMAGLLAQGLPPFDAACCGVYLHGAAGERVSQELGDAGGLATDLLLEIPKAIRSTKASL